jgi:8-oxo-dGTP diphosphatase
VIKPRIEVACAVIVRGGLLLAARRGPGMSHAGRWEFPGGKICAGENAEDALRRELREELGIEVVIHRALAVVVHDYPAFTIILHPFACGIAGGEPAAREHSEARWLTGVEAHALAWTEADLPVLRRHLESAAIR